MRTPEAYLLDLNFATGAVVDEALAQWLKPFEMQVLLDVDGSRAPARPVSTTRCAALCEIVSVEACLQPGVPAC